MILPDNTTLREAKTKLRENLMKGDTCPCCNQPAKMYIRGITSSMAYGLILMAQHSEDYIHIEDFFKGAVGVPSSIRGDIPKLRFWGLIEPKIEPADDGNPNDGSYRVTDLGRNFVNKKINVMDKVKLYNNKFFGFADNAKMISISDAMKNKFNYEEVVKG